MINKENLKTSEDKKQYSLLFEPIGKKRSGYTRYGAAMYFYKKGLLSEEKLEIYRICCKFDNQDALKVAMLYKD
jgi:hypothetical protein